MTVVAHDLREVDARIRTAIERSGMKPLEYVRRMKRCAHAAEMILGGISVATLADPPRGGLTQNEFYGGLWMLLVADLFRDHAGEREAGMMIEFLDLSAEEFRQMGELFQMVGERYYGIPLEPALENAAYCRGATGAALENV